MMPRGAWIGNRVLDAAMLRPELELAFVAGLGSGSLERNLAPLIFTPESTGYTRRPWGSNPIASLMTTSAGRAMEEHLLAVREPLWLVPYAPDRHLEAIVQKNSRLHLASISSSLYALTDDKFFLTAQLARFCPSSLICAASGLTYAEISRGFGRTFVMQLRHSIGGDGTFIIHRASDWQELMHLQLFGGKERIRISRFVQGPTYNINAVVLRTAEGRPGVAVSPPSRQLVGLPACTAKAEKYCGNDFTAVRAASPALVAGMLQLTREIGLILDGLGYKGLFGLDLICDGDECLLLEINPRFQGSTPFLHRLQTSSGCETMIRFHLAAFGAVPAPTWMEVENTYESARASLTGIQLFVYNDAKGPVEMAVQSAVGDEGIVIGDDPRILMDLGLSDEPVLVGPGAALTRISSYDPGFSALNPNFSSLSGLAVAQARRLLQSASSPDFSRLDQAYKVF